MAEGNDSYYASRPERCLELESDCLCDDIRGNIPTSEFSRGCTLEERFEKLPIFEKPLCLIHTDFGGKLAVNESVLSQISLIDVPLNVVAVCGLYRTGKSYLMNRLAGERKGFSLGATTKSHTKGIWAWCKVHPTQDGQILLLLDTEGLADIRKGDNNHDNHLFSLALLLSSTMIYNVQGVFNQEALEKLTFITKLSQDLHVLSGCGKRETNELLIRTISPFFILCLRDFYLEIHVEGQDKQPSPDEYFEQCLEEVSQKDKLYNQIRECIKTYFPNRKCFTLSQPALNKMLQKIEELDDDKLDETFVSEIDKMREFVYEQKQKFLDVVTHIPVQGPEFASITSTYVETLRKGSLLTYQDAFEQVAKHQNSNLAVKAFQEFSKKMDALKLPIKRKVVLQDSYIYHQSKTLSKFRKVAYPVCLEDFEDQIMDKMQKKWAEIESKNREDVRKALNGALNKLYQSNVDNQRCSYDSSCGYDNYEKQMRKMENTYNARLGEYDDDERMMVWLEFKSRKSDENMRIYKAATEKSDHDQYEEFKKTIEEKLQKGFEEQMKKILREREISVDRKLEKMENLLFSFITDPLATSYKRMPIHLSDRKKGSKSCALM